MLGLPKELVQVLRNDTDAPTSFADSDVPMPDDQGEEGDAGDWEDTELTVDESFTHAMRDIWSIVL